MSITLSNIKDEEWESGELGLAQEFVRKVPVRREYDAEDALGLQMISIRLQKELINFLKANAKKEGLVGYQPLIRQILTRYMHDHLK
jgi:predicted DNA binding CopG/RHH family protein